MKKQIGMPKWKKDAKEFEVAMNHNKKRDSFAVNLPKPVVEYLGRPNSVIFKIKKNGGVIVE